MLFGVYFYINDEQKKIIIPLFINWWLRNSKKYDVLPLSNKTWNYGLRAEKSSLRLIKFLVNTIHIYDSKLIYYENAFRNESNGIYLIS